MGGGKNVGNPEEGNSEIRGLCPRGEKKKKMRKGKPGSPNKGGWRVSARHRRATKPKVSFFIKEGRALNIIECLV